MGVKVEFTPIVTASEVRGQLDKFEAMFGVPSDRFYEAFMNGQLDESGDFDEWSSLYSTWLLSNPE